MLIYSKKVPTNSDNADDLKNIIFHNNNLISCVDKKNQKFVNRQHSSGNKTKSMQDQICLIKLKNITINKKYFLTENWNPVNLNTSTNKKIFK